jgi:hypothetical protein
MSRCFLEHVAQRRNERVDAAADVLQIDEQHIERAHHWARRSPHCAVEAEHRDTELRVREIRRLDHVVLLVAAQTVLRAECRGQVHVGQRGQGVERVHQVASDGGRMRQQRDTLAAQALAQCTRRQQAIQTELHPALPSSETAKDAASWKSGLSLECRNA